MCTHLVVRTVGLTLIAWSLSAGVEKKLIINSVWLYQSYSQARPKYNQPSCSAGIVSFPDLALGAKDEVWERKVKNKALQYLPWKLDAILKYCASSKHMALQWVRVSRLASFSG